MTNQNSPPYRLMTFANGLRFISVPMPTSKSVIVLVMVGTGSRYETKDINGVSHFLEHMMFKGTARRPGAMDISHELDSIGANNNAFTGKEYTGYYAQAASENLETILDVISDIFQNSKLDEAEINKERGVIIEEMNMRNDNPRIHVADMFEELLYGDQPLGWDIVGPKEVISNLPREKFVEYFQSHYFAKNTIIAVAGNFDDLTIDEKVKKYFSNVREKDPITALPVKEAQTKQELKAFDKKTDQSHFALGVRTFDRFDVRNEALAVMSVIMGAGMSSRLFTEVREKRGMAYYISSSADTFADTGYFGAYGGVDNARLEEALLVVIGEFAKMRDELVSQRELTKAKNYVRGKTAINLETSDAWASFYADQLLLKNKILTVEEKMAKIDVVTAEDIQAVAGEIFKPERLNLAVVGPIKARKSQLYDILKL